MGNEQAKLFFRVYIFNMTDKELNRFGRIKNREKKNKK